MECGVGGGSEMVSRAEVGANEECGGGEAEGLEGRGKKDLKNGATSTSTYQRG